MAADQIMEMMNSLSLGELQLVTNHAQNLIESLQQGTNENSTNSDDLISASPTPEGASPAATNNKEERNMISTVRRKDKFVLVERVERKPTNVVRGLQLYDGVFDSDEQDDIVKHVYKWQQQGKNGRLARWLHGKGGSTMRFGSKYAEDRKGNKPGILTTEDVDPLPDRLEKMIQKLIDHNILPANCKPDNCVVNIYNIGDCLPPDTYHSNFLRPSCTVSLVTHCNILFGANMKSATEISAPISIHLPAGSVLVLDGNAASVAKHCVPYMTGKRISITFWKNEINELPLKKSQEKGLKTESASGTPTRSSPGDPLQHQTPNTMTENGSEMGEE